MKDKALIATTQRSVECNFGEIRDSLDQRWLHFFSQCQLIPVVIPNNLLLAQNILAHVQVDGILLTGGGDISSVGGRDHDREEVEELLIKLGVTHNIPLLGVCRGMQKIQTYFGARLIKVMHHIQPHQDILIHNLCELVNSYHQFGTTEPHHHFKTWATAYDGVIKAIEHKQHKISGIMWHPERMTPFRKQDIQYFKDFYQ